MQKKHMCFILYLILMYNDVLLANEVCNSSSSEDDVKMTTLVQIQMPKLEMKFQQQDLTTINMQLHKKNLALELEKKECSLKLKQLELEIERLNSELRLQRYRQPPKFDALEEKLNSLETKLNSAVLKMQSVSNDERKLMKEMKQEILDKQSAILSSMAIQGEKTEIKINSLNQASISKIDYLMKLLEEVKKSEALTNNKILMEQQEIMKQIQSIAFSMNNKFMQLGAIDLKTEIINDKIYYISFDQPKMNWTNAEHFCKSHGMQLISIETKEEWEALKSKISGRVLEKFHISPWSSGMRLNIADKNKWTWTAIGREVIYKEFQHMKSEDDFNCLVIYTSYWVNRHCSEPRPFICEMK